MSSILLLGDTSGSITVAAPAVAGSGTLTLPTGTGTLGLSGPAFSAYITGSNTIAANTAVIIPFNTKSGGSLGFDTGTCYNNTGSTVTLNGLSAPAYSFCPNVAGYYQINTMVGIYSASSGVAYTKLYKNGGAIINGQVLAYPSSSQGLSPVISAIVYLNGTGDYLQIYAIQNSGSTLNIDNGSWSYFSGCFLRGA